MKAPIRPLKGTLPEWLERRARRFVWQDPGVVAGDTATPAEFRTAMAALNVGDTIKITGANRHPNADALLFDNLDLTNADIVDIGASDGSTSVDLIGKLPGFKSNVIADLYLFLSVRSVGRHRLFFDGNGVCILIVGPRVVAWPSISASMRLRYRRLLRTADSIGTLAEPVLLLNPTVRSLMASDPRVTYRVHDVFATWSGEKPHVIKVANLLRRFYFADDILMTGLQAILSSLDEGGHFLIVDNSREKNVGPRAGLYRRRAGRFEKVAETPRRPEIHDLIERVALPVSAMA